MGIFTPTATHGRHLLAAFLMNRKHWETGNPDFPIKHGDFPIKNGDFPIKNCDFPIKWLMFVDVQKPRLITMTTTEFNWLFQV
jgi:hypothetical protein